MIKIATIAIMILSLFPGGVYAESPKGLTLAPLRSELNITPGISHEGTLKVTNTTNSDMIIQLSAEAFGVINQQYDYAFDAQSKLVDWVRFDKSNIKLSPSASATVAYTLAVPVSAEPGGRYISLFASSDIESDSSGINSRQRIGSLLYIAVAGDVTRSGSLLSLSSPIFTGGSNNWSMLIQNSGTVHFRSHYDVTLNNIFTKKEVVKSSDDSLILPGTVRSIMDQVPVPRWPGIYKITYDIGLGDTPTANETRYIVYIPTNLLIYFMTALLLAGSVWLYSRRKAKLK